MRTFLLTLALLLSAALSAQTASGTARVGTRMIDQSGVEGQYIDFGKPLYDFRYCEKGNYLLLMFRQSKNGKWKNKGEISLLRLDDKTVAWTKPFNYATAQAFPTSHGVLTYEKGIITMLDDGAGYEVWRQERALAQVDDENGVVMAYDYPQSKHLRGYGLDYGQELWEIKVPHNEGWGWNNVQRVDSTWLMVVNNDLTLLDPRTGEFYQYEAKTGIADTKAMLLSGLAAFGGAVAGAALAGAMVGGYGTGYYYYPVYIGNNVITGLHSNLCPMEGGHWLFADRRKLVRLDKQLNVVWEHELPEKTAAHSILLAQDSLVYMLNMGVGWNGAAAKKAGRPFVAAYSVTNGKEVYMNMLSMKKDIIVDALLNTEGLFMMDDEGLSYKHRLTSPDVSQTTWNTADHGKLRRIVSTPVYAHREGTTVFEQIPYDGQNCPVMNDSGTLFVVNKDLRIWKQYAPEEQYYTLFDNGDSRWVCRRYMSEDLWVIHPLGVSEIHFDIPFRRLVRTHDAVYASGADGKIYILNI